ncbi:MAG: asparagine synthase-related protein, partial [Rhodothermales bacterium]
WHLWTNRFGTVHVYYASDGQRAALGTFFPAVAAAASDRRLDWVGITGFFGSGFFPQDRTFYQDVRILRPASHYVFDDQGILQRERRYWNWWHRPDSHRSYDDTVAEFGSLFGEVMRDQAREGRLALPISGGLDSRSTVAALTRKDTESQAPIWAYSYGYMDDSVETRIARRIAGARHLPLRRFTIKPYLFDQLDRVLAAVEGFQDVTQCRQAFVSDELAQEADYVVAAHWGDVWLDDMGVAAQHQPSGQDDLLRHALNKMLKRGRHWLLEHVCRPHLDEEPDTVLREMVRDELARVEHLEDAGFRMKAFKTDQWSFRWTLASLRMFQPGAFPRLPFYDTRLTDFFCSVPSEYVRGRRLQIDYLKRFAPDLAGITWQAWDANLYRYQHFNTWMLPKRALKKAWRLLVRRRVVQRNWEVQFLNEQGRQGLEHWLVRPGLRLHDLVQPPATQRLLDDFYNEPGAANGYTVSMLLTFSAWLEQYGSA